MGRLVLRVPYLRMTPSGWYWEPSRRLKRLGFCSIALGTNDTEAIRRARELNLKVDAEKARGPHEPQVRKETIAWIIKHCYLPSESYLRLAPKTKVGYDRALLQIEKWAGDQPARAVNRKAIKAWQRALEAATSRLSAAATLRVLRIVMGIAVDEGLIEMNPALRLRLATPGERNRTWSDEEVDAFCQKAVQMGRMSLACALQLGLWIGQRQADILQMKWDQITPDLETIYVKQQKTNEFIAVTIAPDLKVWLERIPRREGAVIASETTNEPYGEHNFRHLVGAIREAAGLGKDLQFLDLRRSSATRLAQAGCSLAEIQAITGHRTLQIVGRYVRPDTTMAKSAMSKLIANRAGLKK